MSSIKESIVRSLKRAFLTFQTFPVVLACAVAFTAVTLVRIWMDWPQQEAYNFPFNCLHLAFSTGAIAGLAAIAFSQRRYAHAKSFAAANGVGALAAVLAFILLYFFGGREPEGTRELISRVTDLAAARISVTMMVSFIAFIYFAGQDKESDFSRSLFMTQKAFLIALIYGGATMSGTSSVAGAFQALLYRDMSEKVYMVLAALIGLFAFAIFVGYFPDLRKDRQDPRRQVAQQQPKFIEVLFEYITVPIVLVLTLVLLSWAGKTVITGDWPNFSRLFGIVTSYAIGGIWLHMMIARRESGITDFYRKAYPIALLVILAFGAWALGQNLSDQGLKSDQYFFALVLITAAAAGILLLLKKVRAHEKIAVLICIMAVVSVSPLVGYHALPVRVQLNRLEGILTEEGLLVEGQLYPAARELDEDIRIEITDIVYDLAYKEGAALPEWFDHDLDRREVFTEKLGFEPTWAKRDLDDDRTDQSLNMYLRLPNVAVDIGEYDWAVHLNEWDKSDRMSTVFDGSKGTYRVEWMPGDEDYVPELTVWLDDELILTQELDQVMAVTSEAVRSRSGPYEAKDLEEMSLVAENEEVKVLVVIRYMNIMVDPREDRIESHMEIEAVYLKEK